jgi:hypothetical protein
LLPAAVSKAVAGVEAMSEIRVCLPNLPDLLLSLAACNDGPGFLDGTDGAALALHAATDGAPLSGRDACLLIS